MKILLNRDYLWHDATYGKNGFCIGGLDQYETNILAVEDDNIEEYVRCPKCGLIFHKDDPEAAEHVALSFDVEKCRDCRYIRERNGSTVSKNVFTDENGIYKLRTSVDVSLYCTMASDYIGTHGGKVGCIYNRCAGTSMKAHSTIFSKYPDVFDKFLTVSKIMKYGYKDSSTYSTELCFRLKGRRKIIAVVNSYNIVDKFFVWIGSTEYAVRYSYKYNKIFEVGVRSYNELKLMDKDVHDAICAQIRKYYE